MRPPVKPYLWAVASGALYALANERAALWPLAFVAVVPLLYALQQYARGTAHALRLGLAAGVVLHGGAYRWLLPTIHTYAGLPFAASALAWLLLMLWQAGQLALWCALIARAGARGRSLAWTAPIAFGALERLYPMLFPSPFAAALHGVPLLLQSLELWGAAPLSMLLVLVNVRLAEVVRELAREIVRRVVHQGALARAARLLGFALLAWVALALYGSLRTAQVREQVAHAPSLRVGVVQANLGTHEKRRDHAGALRKHIVLSRALIAREQPDLLIWPETALPGLLAADTTQLFLPLGFHVPLLTGAVVYHHLGTRTLLHNSAFLLDADQHVLARSDKLRLVPFAERLPFGEQYPVLYDLVPGAGQFTPGRAPVSLQLNGKRIAALICYEDILPELVRDVMERAQPQLLVNITNDAWFGDTPAPHYHLSLSTLRTIEQRRFLVRATNSGVSAIVDPTGAVLQQTHTFEQATFSARVGLLSVITPYERSGDLLGWTAVLACAWLLLGRARQRA